MGSLRTTAMYSILPGTAFSLHSLLDFCIDLDLLLQQFGLGLFFLLLFEITN